MQISSTNSGSFSSSGLYPTVLPTTRKPDVGLSANADVAASAASKARTLQQVAPPVAATSSDASHGLVLARQRAGVDAFVAQIGQSGNEAAAQRAVAEYATVAVQEQRFELDEVLTGVDVFA